MLNTTAAKWIVLALVATSWPLAACGSPDSEEVVKEWERSINLFEHRCDPVYEAAADLLGDTETLHALRSGDGTDHQRQIVEDVEDCNDSNSDILAYIDSNEEHFVAEWGSDPYTNALESRRHLQEALQETLLKLGPYSSRTEETIEQQRLSERARAEEEAQLRHEEHRACPHRITVWRDVDVTSSRVWAAGTLREDGSMRLWVAVAATPALYDPCLAVEETARTAVSPQAGTWYRSGPIEIRSQQAEIATRGRLNADGSFELELVGSSHVLQRPTVGRVASPKAGVVYRATKEGQRLSSCEQHLRYGVDGSQSGAAWAVARVREDGSLQIWVAASSTRPATYDPCLTLRGTSRVARDPTAGRWYNSGTYKSEHGSVLQAQAMLEESGQLLLRLMVSSRPQTSERIRVVADPKAGVTYTQQGSGALLFWR